MTQAAASDDPSTASTLPAPPSGDLKQCTGCAAVYTHEEWLALPTLRQWVFPDEVLQIADCTGCGSTISRAT